MKIFLISDNIDSCLGFRLAGIEGIAVNDKKEFMDILHKTINNPEIGIILITDKLVSLDYDVIYDLKLKYVKPLIVEIPDRYASFHMSDSITRYVREAIGIKI